MVSNSLRKMSDIHKNISIFERKLNAALVVAQDKPASVVKNYNSGKYYLMKYTGCKDDRNGDTLGQRKKMQFLSVTENNMHVYPDKGFPCWAQWRRQWFCLYTQKPTRHCVHHKERGCLKSRSCAFFHHRICRSFQSFKSIN